VSDTTDAKPEKSGRQNVFTVTASRHFADWLKGIVRSLAFTTYQGGKLFLLGLRPDGALSVFRRSFPRCMELAVSDDRRTLMMATKSRVYRLNDILSNDREQEGYDAVYSPHQSWITGDIDIHDISLGTDGWRPRIAAT
jgi:uncharacterized protein (TIGR03032 family)